MDRLYTKAVDVAAASLVDLESLKTANEVLEVNFEQTKAANGRIEPLTDQNKARVKTCQGLKKKVAEQIDKLRESSASNEELSRKLQKSEEVEPSKTSKRSKACTRMCLLFRPSTTSKERSSITFRPSLPKKARQSKSRPLDISRLLTVIIPDLHTSSSRC